MQYSNLFYKCRSRELVCGSHGFKWVTVQLEAELLRCEFTQNGENDPDGLTTIRIYYIDTWQSEK